MKTFLIALLALTLAAGAADITTSQVFTLGQKNINSAEMNAIIGNAVINASFITGKTEVTAPATSFQFLLANPANSRLYKMSLLNLYTNFATNLFNGVVDSSPDVNADYLLEYDTSAGLQKQVLMNKVVFGGASFDAPIKTDYIPIWDSTSNAQKYITLYNLFAGATASTTFTASDILLKYSDTPANFERYAPADMILNASSLSNSITGTDQFNMARIGGQWGRASLNSLFIGSTASNSIVGAGNKFLMYSTNASNMVNVPISAIASYITNQSNGFFTNYVGTTNAIAAAGVVISNAHGLGVVPSYFKAVYVCAVSTNGYGVGEELDSFSVGRGTDGFLSAPAISCDSTNVYFALNGSSGFAANAMGYQSKSAGTIAVMNTNIWRLKFYARP